MEIKGQNSGQQIATIQQAYLLALAVLRDDAVRLRAFIGTACTVSQTDMTVQAHAGHVAWAALWPHLHGKP
jgi:hypothetical protein